MKNNRTACSFEHKSVVDWTCNWRQLCKSELKFAGWETRICNSDPFISIFHLNQWLLREMNWLLRITVTDAFTILSNLAGHYQFETTTPPPRCLGKR